MWRAEPRTPLPARGREGQSLPWLPRSARETGALGTQTGVMRRLRPHERVRNFKGFGRWGRWGRKPAPNVRARDIRGSGLERVLSLCVIPGLRPYRPLLPLPLE